MCWTFDDDYEDCTEPEEIKFEVRQRRCNTAKKKKRMIKMCKMLPIYFIGTIKRTPNGYYYSPCSRKPYKFHKKMSNKKVRRYKGYLSNGCEYRKLYEYWYNIF